MALQPAVTVTRSTGAALAGRLVLAGAHARPGRQPAGGAEAGHVHPDLRDDRLGQADVDAGDGDQQVTLDRERADHLLDTDRHPPDRFLQVVDVGQDLADDQRMGGPEAAGQRLP